MGNYKLGQLTPSSKVLVSDFDLTITSQRIYGRRDFAHLPKLFGGQERINLLHRFFEHLKSHGVVIFIASWNFDTFIRESLSKVHIHHGPPLCSFIDGVLDRPHVEANGGFEHGKQNLVAQLIQENSLNAANVVVVDDTDEHLEGMSVPCKTLQVPGTEGMSIADMQAVCNLLGLPDLPAEDKGGSKGAVMEGVAHPTQSGIGYDEVMSEERPLEDSSNHSSMMHFAVMDEVR